MAMNKFDPPVLLVLTTTKSGIRSEVMAIQEAVTRKTSLAVLFVLDPAMASAQNRKILSGLLGPAAGRPLGKTILRDYEARAKNRFDEIRAQCEKLGITFESRICTGPFVIEVRSYVQSHQPSVAILPKRQNSFLNRLFMKDELTLIKSTAPHTQIRIVEEDL